MKCSKCLGIAYDLGFGTYENPIVIDKIEDAVTVYHGHALCMSHWLEYQPSTFRLIGG